MPYDLVPVDHDPFAEHNARLNAIRDYLTPEWSKPFAGMSAAQAESEARILSDPNANPARVGKIGPGYLSDTDRLGAATLDVGSMVAPELKGAAALKGVLAATKTLPPIGPELGSGLRAARQMTDLSANGIVNAPVVPLRSYEIARATDPGIAGNWNVPQGRLEWRGGEDPGKYSFVTDTHNRTLGGVYPDWQWNDATNSGRYVYRPQLSIRDPRSNTYSPFGQQENPAAFDRQEEAQQYVEKMLAGGDFSREAHDRVLAELAPQIEARQRAEAAQAARGKFSVVPPDRQLLLRDVTARGRSGRPLQSAPFNPEADHRVLEAGYRLIPVDHDPFAK